MWLLILISCVGLQCEKPQILSTHESLAACEKYMDMIEAKNGQYTKCQKFDE